MIKLCTIVHDIITSTKERGKYVMYVKYVCLFVNKITQNVGGFS